MTVVLGAIEKKKGGSSGRDGEIMIVEGGRGRLERDVGKSVHAPWTGSIAFPIYAASFLSLSLFLLLPQPSPPRCQFSLSLSFSPTSL